VGAYFFSGRAIPALDAANLPVTLCDGSQTNGDVMRVLQVFHYIAPVELRKDGLRQTAGEAEFEVDLRCSACTKAFKDRGALIAHW
jgi:hypothetical protein